MSEIKNISLYIPHVFPNFDKEYVSNALNNIGEISQIDFVPKQDRNGNNFNAVYVHFNKWYNNKYNRSLYSNIMENGFDHLYHDNMWYWIMLPNNAKKHIPGERKRRIDVSELFKTPVKVSEDSVCPDTPVKSEKPTYTEEVEEVKQSLENIFDEEAAAFEAEIEAEMDEIEKFMDEQDEQDGNIIKIDGRYVQQLEAENWAMRIEIANLRSNPPL